MKKLCSVIVSRRSLLATVMGVATLAITSPAEVQGQTTFAQFTQASAGTPFTYDNLENGAALITSFGTQINFNFLNVPGIDNTPVAATLTLVTTTNAPATQTGDDVTEPINNPGGLIQILRNSDGKNLLTVTFNGMFDGSTTSSNGTVSADTNSGNLVTFTSDFLLFDITSRRALSLNLTSITPNPSIGTLGLLSDFVASLGGSFASTPLPINAVPEPASYMMLGLGLVALPVLRRRMKAMRTA